MKVLKLKLLFATLLLSLFSHDLLAADQALFRLMHIDDVGARAVEVFESREKDMIAGARAAAAGGGATQTITFMQYGRSFEVESPEDARSKVSTGNENDIKKPKLQPGLSAGEKEINPSLTFSTTKGIPYKGNTKTISTTFEFAANSKLDTDEPNEMLKSFLFQGGDLNFNLGFNIVPQKGWLRGFGFQAFWKYALLSGDELSVDSSVNEVDAEIKSFSGLLMYNFN